MKKVLAVMLVAIMALSLVACGSKKDATGTWTVKSIGGQDYQEFVDSMKELYEQMGAEDEFPDMSITMTVTKDKVTMKANGEEEVTDIKLEDDGFTVDGQKAQYNADKDTITIDMGDGEMVFVRK